MLLVHEHVHMASMYDFKNNKLPEDCWGGCSLCLDTEIFLPREKKMVGNIENNIEDAYV